MKNVQITVDEELLAEVDRAGKPLGLNRSQIVRHALRDWLKRQRIERFEREWIAALRSRQDDPESAERWTGVQSWGEE